MLQSHIIEVNGTFIGAAMPTTDGFRFRAVHPRVDELDGFSWTSLQLLRQATGHLFRIGRVLPTRSDKAEPPDIILARHNEPRAEPHLRPSPAAPWLSR